MHPRTLATLDKLHAVTWFRNVGVRDTETADVLGSWPEAVESCESIEWENHCLEAANHYFARVSERDRSVHDRWNPAADECRPIADALVEEKVRDVVQSHGLPKGFVDTVKWDMIHLCLECEFADIYPPGFFASQSYWYHAGHFPCGWRGAFPEGRLVVY